MKWLLGLAQLEAWVFEVAPLDQKLSAFSTLSYVVEPETSL